MDGTLLLAAGTAALGALGALESYWHRRNLASIPIRIHVNGTRGKSGVTRLIAAGLRAGGIRTCAKTTGTLPQMIFPDGTEYPVFRPARANVKEQIRVVRAAALQRAEALVIECMALNPGLQAVCELKLVRSTHGVITNSRADHLDVMGPTVVDVTRSLAGTTPVGGKLFTAEQTHLNILREAAEDRGSQLIAVDDEAVARVTWDELERFSYIEHPDNVALALKVCQDIGVDRDTALRGMWHAHPDPGVMTVAQSGAADRHTVFVNGFAANDPESTGKIWELVLRRFPQIGRRIAVVNCRADRADRSAQLAEACLEWTPADHYLVTGTATHLFARRATTLGLKRQRITCVENKPLPQLLSTLNQQIGRSALVMGMGNIASPGMDLVQYFERQQNDVQHVIPANSLPTNPTMTRRAA
jgi:poly-gamma-glutamate synthase PgsB/CapB